MTEQSNIYARLIQLEREVRHAGTEDALRFVVVNQTRRLVAYRQAILVRMDGPGLFAVEAISNVPVIDRDAPFVRWLIRVLKTLRPDQPAKDLAGNSGPLQGVTEARGLVANALPECLRRDWAEWWPPEVFWQPLKDAEGHLLGGLILAREDPFQPAERVLVDRLADAYGHAWEALRRRLGLNLSTTRKRARRTMVAWTVVAVTVLILAWPVRQSVLAPSEVVPLEPRVVAAPLEGVIETILVEPNALVEAGTPLFRFEDAPLKARREVAAKQLAVAEADLRQARQSAFRNPSRKGGGGLESGGGGIAAGPNWPMPRNCYRALLSQLPSRGRLYSPTKMIGPAVPSRWENVSWSSPIPPTRSYARGCRFQTPSRWRLEPMCASFWTWIR